MLGAVIVDDPDTSGLDLGYTHPDDASKDYTLTLLSLPEVAIPTSSDLAVRLLKAFYIITGPANWQDFSGNGKWTVDFPSVDVVTDIGPINLDALDINSKLPKLFKPKVEGVGEIWVATQYEETESRDKPGTLTVVDAEKWKVTRKVALPGIVNEMNNPHNMWADQDQNLIYATQWFDKYLITVDRNTGAFVASFEVGEAPAHVMTRVDTDQVHVSLNGEDKVVELAPGGASKDSEIDVTGADFPAQPHAHWMGHNGQTMVTPNSNTGDSSYVKFGPDFIFAKPETGVLPIATGMMPDSSKYYVSNFLSNTISVIDMDDGTWIKDIQLLADYNPISGEIADGANPIIDEDPDGVVAVGALPIQTPVAPNGKYMVTANTLTATITIVDTEPGDAEEDTLEKMLPCDAGCHGVQFGAKKGGGYYAYVTSKFANTLLVVDIDPNNDGEADDAKIVGRLLLDFDAKAKTKIDDKISAYEGMGGQGVLAVPNVYNGWVQNLPDEWTEQLTCAQRTPIDPVAIAACEA
jgi:hypothetical protein